MIRRGSGRFFTLAALGLSLVLVPLGVSSATTTTLKASNNAKTLLISLPGPFNGCTFLDSGAGSTTDGILDLLRPSAFQVGVNGSLVGAGGPIASAELTSLTPETVKYTIAPGQKWNNGAPFTGNALVGWWTRAKRLNSVQSDGYRSIKSMKVSQAGLTVTAVFSTPYADWNLLFRDVEALGSARGCSLSVFAHRPSLGPYEVASASAHRIVLTMNRSWPQDLNRFGRLVITDGAVIPSSRATQFVNYTLSVDRAQLQALSSHPTVLSHIGSSNLIEEMTFAPGRPLTKRLGIRQALSWWINRQNLINQLWGSVTFSPSVAMSTLYSQAQSSYPGGGGNGPTAQTTTSTTTPSAATNGLPDCSSCAIEALRGLGYRRTTFGWSIGGGPTLAVRVVVGPSGLDQSVARYVETQWKHLGIAVYATKASSEMAAAADVAANNGDIAIFSRPTITAPSYAARSWSGPPFLDSYPSGVRSALVNQLFAEGIGTFNPVTASATWLKMDQVLMTDFWVRPLFTSPSLLEWSNSVTGVFGTFSPSGLMDQVTNWT
ncbi:MAG TPA: ABC transporter substrate-binding protein, partial [Acidimicrobiales bacterium]|nr:ABC transporter substrate-binding protein [Acidimicrobiales bacterium]